MNVMYLWLRTVFADAQLVLLLLVLVIFSAIILTVGNLLTPVIASVVIAFLLEGVVRALVRLRVPHLVAVYIVFGLFMLFLTVLLFGLVPLLVSQITDLLNHAPSIIAQGQHLLNDLPHKYPMLLTQAQIQSVLDSLTSQISLYGQQLLAMLLASMRSLFSFVVYLILMPLMVFFFLKDKEEIVCWFKGFLPADHSLVSRVGLDVRIQAGNYVRGRIWEILLVWAATYACFLWFGLDYALLLSLCVGLSVIIPYIGAVVVTVPVVVIAFIQWGFTSDFTWALAAYLLVQLLDANFFVPLLLSEAVNLHPLASITAILLFGGFWGFWGVFFAIPLAIVAQAVLTACAERMRPDQAIITT
ncbi:MAG: AI-2E family transporter [Desulfovibrionales bacterium]|nr:AI-2E family transporter [Desulfovibrionales bacterium]